MQVGEGTRTATRMQGELRTAMEATQAAERHAQVCVNPTQVYVNPTQLYVNASQGELRTAMEATQAAEWHARVRVCRTVCPSGLLGSFLCYRPGLCHCRLRIAI